MKKRIFKKGLLAFLAICSSAIVSVPVIVSSVSCAKNISDLKVNKQQLSNNQQNNGFIYNGTFFKTIDELVDHYIVTHPNIITNDFYLGDLNSAIIDTTTGLVNINDLYKYNPDRLKPVYLNALNNPTLDYNEAKYSFINQGLIRIKYYDFNNNIFNSYSEAEESILNSKNSFSVQHYQNIDLSNNTRIQKFNPLSKQDVFEFKKKIYNEISKNLLQTSNGSNVSLKMYDNTYYDASEQKYLPTSEFSNYILDENFINNIIRHCIENYFNSKFKMMKYDMNYDVSISLDESLLNSYWADYYFSDFYSTNSDYYVSSENILQFNNVNFSDLNQFNIFVNRDDFVSKSKITISKWACNKVAEVAEIKDFLSNKVSFKLNYKGKSNGPAAGIDYKILEYGTDDYMVAFKVNIKPKLKNGSTNYSYYLQQEYNNKIKSYKNLLGQNSAIYQLYDHIAQEVWNNLSFEDTNLFKNINKNPTMSSTKINLNWIKNLTKDVVYENKLLKQNFNLLGNSFLVENHFLKKEFFINTTNLNYIAPTEKIINVERLKQKLVNILNEKKWVIELNNAPLFKTNFNFNNDSSSLFAFENSGNNSNSNKNKVKLLSVKFKIKDYLKNNFFKDQIINSKLNDKQTQVLDSFQNTSQSFKFNQKQKPVLYENKNILYFDKQTNSLKFNYLNDLNNSLIQQDEEIIPNLTYNVSMQYPLNTLVHTYSKIIENVIKQNPNTYQQILKKELVNPEDVLFLYNKNHTLLTTIYREFLSNGQYVSPSLIDNNSINLYDTINKIEEAIRTNLIIKPVQVVIVYDLLGNVINPGVRLEPGNQLTSSSDAIFDPEDIIVDNILRTKIIPQDLNKRFYLDDNGIHHLVDYELNQIYKLKIENKNYYYRTHFDLINALKQYLEMNSERI